MAEERAGAFAECRRLGPPLGYFPQDEKSNDICPESQREAAERAFRALDLAVKFSSGQRYVGGFLGSQAMEDRWIDGKVAGWTKAVQELANLVWSFAKAQDEAAAAAERAKYRTKEDPRLAEFNAIMVKAGIAPTGRTRGAIRFTP